MLEKRKEMTFEYKRLPNQLKSLNVLKFDTGDQ